MMSATRTCEAADGGAVAALLLLVTALMASLLESLQPLTANEHGISHARHFNARISGPDLEELSGRLIAGLSLVVA
jgi:hypothetical protein